MRGSRRTHPGRASPAKPGAARASLPGLEVLWPKVDMINIITTTDSREALESMGMALLEKKLVACVQIVGPITSTYWWKGQIETAEEWMGIMKTRDDLYEEAEREIMSLHPYEVPEIQAVRAEKIFDAYAGWVVGETS